jgi:hypothetical protein
LLRRLVVVASKSELAPEFEPVLVADVIPLEVSLLIPTDERTVVSEECTSTVELLVVIAFAFDEITSEEVVVDPVPDPELSVSESPFVVEIVTPVLVCRLEFRSVSVAVVSDFACDPDFVTSEVGCEITVALVLVGTETAESVFVVSVLAESVLVDWELIDSQLDDYKPENSVLVVSMLMTLVLLDSVLEGWEVTVWELLGEKDTLFNTESGFEESSDVVNVAEVPVSEKDVAPVIAALVSTDDILGSDVLRIRSILDSAVLDSVVAEIVDN